MKALIRGRVLRPIAKRYFRPRWKNDTKYQERLLRYFIVQNTRTVRWKKHDFSRIKAISDF